VALAPNSPRIAGVVLRFSDLTHLATFSRANFQRPDRAGDIGQGRGLGRARAEIFVNGAGDLSLVTDQKIDSAGQPRDALFDARRPVFQVRGLLALQYLVHRRLVVVEGQIHRCIHGLIAPPRGPRSSATPTLSLITMSEPETWRKRTLFVLNAS
jgi:hypothetical protein